MDHLAEKYLRPRKTPSTACSGCGLGQAHKGILQALYELNYGLGDVVWGTSIGCAGRQTFAMWRGDGYAGTHGRVYPITRGLRLALPANQKIVLTVGDGDAFGIGFNHLLHTARVNANVTVIVCDNLGYQSTGGQWGWTTPLGVKTDSSPYGMFEPAWTKDRDVLKMLKEAGATFLARHVSMDGRPLVESCKLALQNNGFSLVHVVYPCTTNFSSTHLGTRNPATIYNWIKNHAAPLGKEGPDTLWATGVHHDARNSRPEFSQLMRDKVDEIYRAHRRGEK